MKLLACLNLLIVLVLFSCKKKETLQVVEEPIPTADYSNSLLAKTINLEGDSVILTYTPLHQLKNRTLFKQGLKFVESIYLYNGSIVNEKFNSEAYGYNLNFNLNAEKKPVQVSGSVDLKLGGVWNVDAELFYENNTLYQLDATLSAGQNTIYYSDRYTYENGNIVKRVNYINSDSCVYLYTYNLMPNAFANVESSVFFPINNFAYNNNFGFINHFGFSNKNLLIKEETIYPDSNSVNTFNYTYNKTDGKVVTRITKNKQDMVVNTETLYFKEKE